MKCYAIVEGESGWFPFREGETVLTPVGTGTVVKPLKTFGPAGWTYVHVSLDGHEDESPYLGTCSIDNTQDQDVISLE